MSKKTNTKKQQAKQKTKRPRVHHRKPRKNPFVFPAGILTTGGPPPDAPLDGAAIHGFMSNITDMMLGVLFVQALKKTDTRAAVLKYLFPTEAEPEKTDENPITPVD